MRHMLVLSFLSALVAGTITLSGAVWAQNNELDRLRIQSLQQQNMQAQEQHNALRRLDADKVQQQVDQFQLRTEQNVSASRPPPPAMTTSPSRMETDNDALRRLQDDQLAASNARLRAIQPAAR